MKSNIIIIVMTLIISVMGYFLFSQNKSYNELLEYKQEELNRSLIEADSLIMWADIKFQALELSRDSLHMEMDSLSVIKVELDSIRNVKIKKSNEKHDKINNSTLSELSGIISGYIK